MAELVGIFAASHGPMIAREWDRLAPDIRGQIEAGFDDVGARLKAVGPDVLVIVSPDHGSIFSSTTFLPSALVLARNMTVRLSLSSKRYSSTMF